MIDFPLLITLIISILIFYFTLFIPLKKELDDLTNTDTEQNSKDYEIKKTNRKGKILLLNIVTTILISATIIIYFAPLVINKFSKIKPLSLTEVIDILLEYLPFKQGFFDNANFQFSYITGIILSIIIIILFLIAIYRIFKPSVFIDYIILIIYTILLAYSLIWINYITSYILSDSIVHLFEFFSIIFNIILYIIVAFIVALIIFIIDIFLS